jgi:two-component system sensor histidine kinase TctE
VLENVGGSGTVETSCEQELTVYANPDLLEQALSAVVENATRYSTDGPITVRCRRANGAVRVEVEDRGPGIPADERAHVFERFYRGARNAGDGFGLGLAIAARATEVLGGTIAIDSEPETGTVVHVTLPERSDR